VKPKWRDVVVKEEGIEKIKAEIEAEVVIRDNYRPF
jgi:hypothetical protein